MNLVINKKAIQLAAQFRQDEGSGYEGGVVVVFKDQVGGWMNELRDPQSWEPGCIAVDGDGNQWVATGGNTYDGASSWEPVATSVDEDSILSEETMELLANVINDIDERFKAYECNMDSDFDENPCSLATNLNSCPSPWVSVKDKLPKDYEIVLISMETGLPEIKPRVDVAWVVYEKGSDEYAWFQYGNLKMRSPPELWMQIPEVPRMIKMS